MPANCFFLVNVRCSRCGIFHIQQFSAYISYLIALERNSNYVIVCVFYAIFLARPF